MSIEKHIEKGKYRLAFITSPGSVGQYYLVDAKTNLLVSLSPRNSKGEVILPKGRPHKNDLYWENVKAQARAHGKN